MNKKQLIKELERVAGKNWKFEDLPAYIRQNQPAYSANCWEIYIESRNKRSKNN